MERVKWNKTKGLLSIGPFKSVGSGHAVDRIWEVGMVCA